MKTARASLTWSLLIVCPHCGHDFDLADHDEDGIYSEPIFSNKWDSLKGEGVECPECGLEFHIWEVEY